MNLIFNPSLKKQMGIYIKRAREKKGYTARELTDALSDEDAGLYDRFKKWENGENRVPIDAIPGLCAVLGCDTGYLFGEYEELTRQHADICSETGLTEDSVNALKEPDVMAAVNVLLSSPRGHDCLRSIFAYISVPEADGTVSITDHGEVVAPTIWDIGLAELKGAAKEVYQSIDAENAVFSNYDRKINASRLAQQAFLLDVESDLKDLRSEYKQPQGYSYSAKSVTRRDKGGHRNG